MRSNLNAKRCCLFLETASLVDGDVFPHDREILSLERALSAVHLKTALADTDVFTRRIATCSGVLLDLPTASLLERILTATGLRPALSY